MQTHKKTIKIAKTVLRIAEGKSRLARHILDRAFPITEEYAQMLVRRLQFGYEGRKPRNQKNVRGEKRPTDMDLASFLVRLLGKSTIVQIPSYATSLPRHTYANQHHISGKRFGALQSLSSHRELLSFGVCIYDMSVTTRSTLEEDTLGALRSFHIMGYSGQWHNGWKGISWNYRQAETGFRDRYELKDDNIHTGYQYFVHPNRRHSIFGAPHLLLKLLWQRLDDEVTFYRSELRRLDNYVTSDTDQKNELLSVGEATSIIVPTFTMHIDGPSYTGVYQSVEQSSQGCTYAQQRIAYLSKIRTFVQFFVRANEASFYHYGFAQGYVAGWIRGIEWVQEETGDAYKKQSHFPISPLFVLHAEQNCVSKRVAL